jgi:hypothetical protein
MEVSLFIIVVATLFIYQQWFAGPKLPQGLQNENIKAVFLKSRGLVYFGEVEVANKDFVVVKNPYYLKTETSLQEPAPEGETPKQELKLVSLGGEGLQLHGPERAMYILWDNIAYIENLRKDSSVVKAINEMQQNKSNEEKKDNK